jgi:hypothetical protein
LAEAVPQGVIGALDALITARRWDIYREPFADAAAFDAYLEDTAATLVVVAGRALGASDAAVPVLRDAGWAFGLANYLRAIPALEAAGRVPLVDGRAEAIRDLAGGGLARLARARAARGLVPRAACPALFAGFRAEPALRAALADPGRVGAGALPVVGLRDSLRLTLMAATGRW